MKRRLEQIALRLGAGRLWRKIVPAPAYGINGFFRLLQSRGFAPLHIVDVGANHGEWTRTALLYFPEARYTLVEPQDHLRSEIDDLIARGHQLHWIHAGAGDQAGTLLFNLAEHDHSSSFVTHSVDPLTSDPARRQIPVPIRTLNEIVASSGGPIPEMVKIDAEGFDLKVLAGASDLFGRTDVFLVEALVCAPDYENNVTAVVARMGQAGYQLMDITDLNRSPKSGLLWLCELAFVRRQSVLLQGITSYA